MTFLDSVLCRRSMWNERCLNRNQERQRPLVTTPILPCDVYGAFVCSLKLNAASSWGSGISFAPLLGVRLSGTSSATLGTRESERPIWRFCAGLGVVISRPYNLGADFSSVIVPDLGIPRSTIAGSSWETLENSSAQLPLLWSTQEN